MLNLEINKTGPDLTGKRRRQDGAAASGQQPPILIRSYENLHSPEALNWLTSRGLHPGEVGAVLCNLPHSLARCIHLYREAGCAPRRTSAARQQQFSAVADLIAGQFGWLDARTLDAQDVHCMVQECSSPTAGRTILHAVLIHAARQGIIRQRTLRKVIHPGRRKADHPAKSQHRANSRPRRQWSEEDWQAFRREKPKGLPERIGVALMIHLGTSWEELATMPGDALMWRIENSPSPELHDDVGGLDLSAGFGFYYHGRRVLNRHLHNVIWNESIACDLQLFHPDALRGLYWRRTAATVRHAAGAPLYGPLAVINAGPCGMQCKNPSGAVRAAQSPCGGIPHRLVFQFEKGV